MLQSNEACLEDVGIPQNNRRVTRWQLRDRVLTPENLPVLKREFINLNGNYNLKKTHMDAENNFSTNNLVLKLKKPQRNFARGTSKSS